MDWQKINAIYKRELFGYFQSWQGVILIVVSLITMGILFSVFAIGDEPKKAQFVLEDFWLNASGVIMILGVILGARVIAEEIQTDRMVLFESSPLSTRQLLYPKVLAAISFLLIVLINSAYIPLYVYSFGTVNIAQILVGYLGLFLLGSACIGIGALGSSLSSNQLVAIVIGCGFLLVLTISWLAVRVVPAPWGDVISYFALHNDHFAGFRRSIIRSQDVFFYLSIALLTIEVAARILRIRRS